MTCRVASLFGGVTPIMPITFMGIGSPRLALPQPRGRGGIDLAACVDDNTVIALRLIGADQAVEHVVPHTLRVAGARIAKPAAARQMQLDGIARRYGLAAFGTDRPARSQRHSACRTVTAAIATACRIFHPLEI